jgi:hypothetical protein
MSYCVAFADAAQFRAIVVKTFVALFDGSGPAGTAGAGAAVVKLQIGPLVDPPAPFATTCQKYVVAAANVGG